MPLLSQHRLALVAPATGAMLLHQPPNPYVFNVRSSYQAEGLEAVAHLHGNLLTRIAMVRVDDSFGRDTLEGALKGFARVGLEPVAVSNRTGLQYVTLSIVDKNGQFRY